MEQQIPTTATPDANMRPLMLLSQKDFQALLTDLVLYILTKTRGRTEEILVDRSGLAEALSVSSSTVTRLIKDGCPHIRVGDSLRFSVDTVIRWLEAREVAPK